ncbi:mitochondrial amidoxime reducing component 2-like [Portunus trituberculatus]|uniref:mitochondrial amidoxime reducing component 2-like n=1 Tax=Portunus trituberculatus TaxID=210409 RepID=UPI001E1CC709|nr:mitochondrial amidoxime reducing component 2-like [Portunus trituberculatus]
MELSRNLTVATILVLGVGTSLGIYVLWQYHNSLKKKRNKMIPRIQDLEQLKQMKWECVGKVKKVFVYPVKSCKGLSVDSAQAHFRGLVYKTARDRSFIIATEKGTMITGIMVPSTVLIEATFEDNILTLNFPGMEALHVDTKEVEKNSIRLKTNIWGEDTYGLDCGKNVSLWLQKILLRKCKLLYHADLPADRVSNHPLESSCPLLRTDDHSLYADSGGYMLMTAESVADLQTRVSSKIAAEDFRPNILIEGIKKPYDEDEWQYVKIGDTVFRNTVPCSRCIFTTVSAETGKKNPDMEPLRTLKTYRCEKGMDSPFFGINLGLDLAGKVSVGDEVHITRSESF